MTTHSKKEEIIKWIKELNDPELINYLKMIKDNSEDQEDWWDSLSQEVKEGIEKGMKDLKEGQVFSHEMVKKKYGK
jgi:gas vesicle protein